MSDEAGFAQGDLERALGVEARVGESGDYHDLGSAFEEELRALGGEAAPEAARWDVWAFRLFLSRTGEYRDMYGPLAPMMVMEGRAYPPPVEELPEPALDYFETRLGRTANPSSRARLADLLWITRRRVADAQVAIRTYLDAHPLVRVSDVGRRTSLEYLERATVITREINGDADRIVAALYDAAFESLREGHWAEACQIIRFGRTELARSQAQGQDLLNRLTAQADESAAEGGEARRWEQHLVDAALDLVIELGEVDLADSLRRRAVDSLVAEADERTSSGGIVEGALVEDALRRAIGYGMSDRITGLRDRMQEASVRSLDEMREMSVETTIARPDIERDLDDALALAANRGAVGQLCTFATVRGIWIPWEGVIERTEQARRDTPLQFLVRKTVLRSDGRPLSRPTSEPEAFEFDTIHRYNTELTFRLAISESQVQILRERETWSLEGLCATVTDCPLLGDDFARRLRAGFQAYEDGRYWEALHLLAPQIEAQVRQIAQAVGTSVVRGLRSRSGLQWASLGDLLDDKRVRATLDLIAPEFGREARYVLADERGWNLRNEVAHGTSPGDANDNLGALALVLVVVAISSLRIRNEQNQEA